MSFNWFPLGLACGKAFCNRENERHQLIMNFKQVRHSLLVSPRRYGKTSLVLQSIHDGKYLYEKLDFFTVTHIDAAEQRILDGVASLIPKLINKGEQALRATKDLFKRFHITLQYKDIGFSLGITPKEKDVAQSIVCGLKGLENLAKKTRHNIVFFLDEIQAISLLENNIIIEGAIREVVQESKHVAYVFSGSNRHLLSQLFDDRSRPLYLLSQRININRIEPDAYYAHFQKAANETWHKNVEVTAMQNILKVTECHPYYVNALCSKLWSYETPPDEERVYDCWQTYAEEERGRILGEIDQLPYNQRKLLVNIAKAGDIKEPTSRSFLSQSNLSSASMLLALKSLMNKDYLEKSNGTYRLIDPLMKTLLSHPD